MSERNPVSTSIRHSPIRSSQQSSASAPTTSACRGTAAACRASSRRTRSRRTHTAASTSSRSGSRPRCISIRTLCGQATSSGKNSARKSAKANARRSSSSSRNTRPSPTRRTRTTTASVASRGTVQCFNVAQVDNFALPDTPATSIIERDQAADAFFAATRADIRHGGERAFYRPSDDFIQMPDERLFRGSQYGTAKEDYYCVLGHELGIF